MKQTIIILALLFLVACSKPVTQTTMNSSFNVTTIKEIPDLCFEECKDIRSLDSLIAHPKNNTLITIPDGCYLWFGNYSIKWSNVENVSMKSNRNNTAFVFFLEQDPLHAFIYLNHTRGIKLNVRWFSQREYAETCDIGPKTLNQIMSIQ